MLVEGRRQTLRSWIARLGENIIAANGQLLYCLAFAEGALNPSAARHLAEQAYERLVEEHDRIGQLRAAAWAVITFMIEREDLSGLDPWITALESLLTQPPAGLPPALEAEALGSLILGLIYRDPSAGSLPNLVCRMMGLIEHPPPEMSCLRDAVSVIIYSLYAGNRKLGERLHAIILPILSRPTRISQDSVVEPACRLPLPALG